MRKNSALFVETVGVQTAASDPRASAFVSANAGSGKTHVLTQRVLRLLLAGTPPSQILCLTYTKAAAANMSERVFNALAAWTRMDDAALRAEIVKTGAGSPDANALKSARRLFARTVETPGGLKLQTIHAFCDRLLHLFPFEANVPASFEQVDAPRQAALLAQAQRQSLARGAADATLAERLKIVAREASQAGFDKVVADALKHRQLLRHAPPDYAAALARRLGLLPGQSVESVLGDITEGGIAQRRWPGLALRFDAGTANDQKIAGKLRAAAAAAVDLDEAAAIYLGVFLTKEHEPRKSLVTKFLHGIYPDLRDALEAEQRRLPPLVETLKAAHTLKRSTALAGVLKEIIGRYEGAKTSAGLLDFDDLTARVLALLTRSTAAWVLYKLDAGIDHILVDEAQDTSPDQWKILQLISADFMTGFGARDIERSVFAVGDVKQSVFSFQGAAPQEFVRMQKYFEAKAKAAQRRFLPLQLLNSLRSAAAIVQTVDQVFALPENFAGLSAGLDEVGTVHNNILEGLPGLVELWPVVTPEPAPENQDWRLPDDFAAAADPPGALAQRIAALIADWLKPTSAERVADKHRDGAPRAIGPGDVMILVRRRNAFFEAMIRALKQAGVPVAGADRLRLLDHIAVEDLVAAARAALLPDDDLTLAEALKSPLIGLDDDDLLVLAPERAGSLYQALVYAASSAPRFAAAAAAVESWRSAASATPFDFFAGLLGPGAGKSRLLARLGPEAEDAIDEFLSFALSWQQRNAASLAAFVAALRDADLVIKRDLEAAGGAVRVMTAHGAKGLEAKIVFLPDTCGVPDGQKDPSLFELGNPPLLAWSPRKAQDCAAVAAARQIADAARADEYRRLLYVAMTRAEERLYVCGYAGPKGRAAGCWHAMIETAIAATLAPVPAHWDAAATVLRRADPWPQTAVAAAAAPPAPKRQVPAWLWQPAAAEPRGAEPLRPSQALAGEDASVAGSPRRAGAVTRGLLVHSLLQHLPPLAQSERAPAARRFLSLRAPQFDAAEREALLAETFGVLAMPELADLFGRNAKAEASIAGTLNLAGSAQRPVSGQIDRLVETPSGLVFADFKTGALPQGEAPPHYVWQLALYDALLAQLYPGLPRRALLVWTGAPRVETIAPAALSAALASYAVAGVS